MTATMAYYGEDFCLINGRDYMRSWMGNPIPFCQACEERRCQKCNALTGGEEAYVDGQIWCHPCADAA